MLRIRYWLVVTLLNRRELTLVLKPARTLHSAADMAGLLRSQNEVLSLDKRDRQSLFQDNPSGPSATLRRPRFSFFQSSIVKEQTNLVVSTQSRRPQSRPPVKTGRSSIRIHSETSERVRQSLAAPPPSLVRRFLGPTPNQVNSHFRKNRKNLQVIEIKQPTLIFG
ncbi:hypothetical protein [Mycoplana dimorpha]